MAMRKQGFLTSMQRRSPMDDQCIDTQFVALVINQRPQISVTIDPKGEVLINTSRIHDDYASVEHDSVRLPWDDLPAVIEALQKVVDDNGIE